MAKKNGTMLPGEYPYDDYLISKPIFHKKEGRYYVVLLPIDKDSGLKRSSTALARYMMSVDLGRKLERWEQVDHIDEDKTNDVLSNLQILTIAQNNRKHIKKSGKTAKFVELICPECSAKFETAEKEKRYRDSVGRVINCSVKCGNIAGSRKLRGKVTGPRKLMRERTKEIPHNTRKGYAYWKCRCKGCYEAYKAAEKARKCQKRKIESVLTPTQQQ